jgi:hypothetical protein
MRCPRIDSGSIPLVRAIFLFAHDLFGKPLHTFPDHALAKLRALRWFAVQKANPVKASV